MRSSPRNRLPSGLLALGMALAGATLAGCASPSGIQPMGIPARELPIDLQRFMGDWYVIAHIPTSVESAAHQAVESYTLRKDGDIDVRFRFCDGGLEGSLEELRMRAWVYDPATNAEWRVRPFWPLRLAYQILELDPQYDHTVIGHPSGRYAWVMARTPEMDEEQLAAITRRLEQRGFETGRMRRVPHANDSCLDDA